MEERQTDLDSAAELRLCELLKELRIEATPEANFEERFLYDFHEHVVQAAVCCPARRHIWSHFVQLIHNFGGRRLAYGASSLGVGVVAAGIFALPSADTNAQLATIPSRLKGLEYSLSDFSARSSEAQASSSVMLRMAPLGSISENTMEMARGDKEDASLLRNFKSSVFEAREPDYASSLDILPVGL